MVDPRFLDAAQLDAVQAVANVGAGHAAAALSEMTRRAITISVAEVRVVRLEEVDRLVEEPGEVAAVVMMKMLGDITGRAIQIFPGHAAAKVTHLLLGGAPPRFPDGFDEMHQSAVTEVANIMAGAYLTALSELMGMLVIMSTPSVAIDMVGAVMATSYLNFGEARDNVFCVSTELLMDKEQVRAHFLLIPDEVSLQVILDRLKLA
jgi:chemotaxis protein CheC